MKYFITILLLICFSQFATAQNLVPNPSFEDTVKCPTHAGDTYSLVGWEININTADYFNSCSKNILNVSVPKNAWGFQCPANGKAYAGIYTYVQTNPGSNEFIGSQLFTPLTIGQKYFISFKVSLADANPSLMCGVDNLGALFTNINYSHIIAIPSPVLQNKANIKTSLIVKDTANWVSVKGSFIADSAYQYILIGHFYDNSHTLLNCLDSNNTNNRWSYYFIDDVCVSTDSLTCEISNGLNTCDSTGNINDLNFVNINIYPNPVSDKIFIDLSHFKKTSIKIYNLFGQIIFENYFFDNNIIIDLSLYPNGLYLIQITQDNNHLNKIITLIK